MIYCILFMGALVMNTEEPKIFEAIRGIGQNVGMLPTEKGVSLPLISIENGDIIVYRLFYYQVVRPHQNLIITAPKYVAKYNLSRSRFEQLKRLDGGDDEKLFEIFEDEVDKKTVIEYSELWDLYDILLPSFKAGKMDNFDRETVAAANKFMQAFDLYAEDPLLDFYDEYGGEFFSFVKRIAQNEN